MRDFNVIGGGGRPHACDGEEAPCGPRLAVGHEELRVRGVVTLVSV